MADSLHIVCPHCDSINRLSASRLHDRPACGNCKQPLFDAHPVELKSGNFALHISRNDVPVLVDFWAPWCGPCRMMAPAFVQAAAQLEPEMRLAKLNTEGAGAGRKIQHSQHPYSRAVQEWAGNCAASRRNG